MRWRDDHPLGIEGLLSIDISTTDLAEARELFASKLGWQSLGERDLPGEQARGAAFHAGDVVIEALCTTRPDSPLALHASETKGICGITFKVRSAKAAAAYLEARGLALIGDCQTRFAIVPDHAQGRLIWFTEQVPEGWPEPSSQIACPPDFAAVLDDGVAASD
jgi:hypothetical protein